MNPAPLRGGVLSGERLNYLAMNYTVKIRRDKCSGIWYVLSSGVPGLNVEGDTREEIEAEIRELAPELLHANGCGSGRYDLQMER